LSTIFTFKKASLLFTSLAISALFSSATHAQESTSKNDIAINLKAGLVGAGFDVTKGINDDFKVRLGYATFKHDDTYNETDASYKGKLKIGGWNLLADYHPWSGGFRLSAGAYSPSHELSATGIYTGPASTITINKVAYSSKDLTDVQFQTKWSGVRPYLGLGYDGFNKTQSNGVFFTADVGVIFSGAPSVSLTAKCTNPSLCNSINANINAELAKIKTDLNDVKYLPVVQVGIGYRF
jgi:phosphate-selective porin